MPKRYSNSFVKKVINEKEFLCVKLGKAISKKEVKVLRTYLVDCLKTFDFDQKEEIETG